MSHVEWPLLSLVFKHWSEKCAGQVPTRFRKAARVSRESPTSFKSNLNGRWVRASWVKCLRPNTPLGKFCHFVRDAIKPQIDAHYAEHPDCPKCGRPAAEVDHVNKMGFAGFRDLPSKRSSKGSAASKHFCTAMRAGRSESAKSLP